MQFKNTFEETGNIPTEAEFACGSLEDVDKAKLLSDLGELRDNLINQGQWNPGWDDVYDRMVDNMEAGLGLHHVTFVHVNDFDTNGASPGKLVAEHVARHLGRKVDFQPVGVAFSRDVIAIYVKPADEAAEQLAAKKAYPHITASTAEDVPAYKSNDLLEELGVSPDSQAFTKETEFGPSAYVPAELSKVRLQVDALTITD